MAISSVNPTTNVPIVDSSQTGFASLTSADFMKLLITQLQNQDPTNPMDSDQLLSQISQMRDLQSSIELSSALKNLTLNQQLSSATSFLGKTVTALHGSDQQQIEGVVDRVQVADGKAMLEIGGQQIELSEVVSVTE